MQNELKGHNVGGGNQTDEISLNIIYVTSH